jgi:multidrug efflux pump subunit AcrA (membrane-fusion protein)
VQTFDRLRKQVFYTGKACALLDALAKIAETDSNKAKLKEAKENTALALSESQKREPNLEAAYNALDKASLALSEIQATTPAPEGAYETAASEIRSGLEEHEPAEPKGFQRFLRNVAWFFGALAGTGTSGIGLYYEKLRPLVHLTVLSFLAILGVYQNYATGADAATFGSQGISQYAMLFLWGVSSDVINKSLQAISFGPKR